MKDEQEIIDLKSVSRRELVRQGVKAAYVVPAVLAAIKATERPAFAQFSCAPNEVPQPAAPDEIQSCMVCPSGATGPAPDGGIWCVPACPPDEILAPDGFNCDPIGPS